MPEPENLQEESPIVVVVVDEVVVDSSALATLAPILPRANITTRPSKIFFAVNGTDPPYNY